MTLVLFCPNLPRSAFSLVERGAPSAELLETKSSSDPQSVPAHTPSAAHSFDSISKTQHKSGH